MIIIIEDKEYLDKKEEVINYLKKRKYTKIYADTPYTKIYNITGQWKNYKHDFDGTGDYTFHKMALQVDFNIGHRFSCKFAVTISTNDPKGRIDHSIVEVPFLPGDVEKQFDALYKIVKGLGFERVDDHYKKFAFMIMNYPYTDEFMKKYIYDIDEKLENLAPRIKTLMSPPRKKGRM